ncbi:MAG: hypothetical protein QNI84_04060 [Henriciella sp.]|nr:hypothetical protein [Henriciella sp.]
MCFRSIAIAAIMSLALPASAQVASEGMGDLNAWGARHLDTTEPEFPSQLWLGSDDETLLGLMQATRTSQLTPAERALLRRVVLSPTLRPTGENAEALLAERARLMLELGEAEAAASIAPQLKEEARGLDAETIAVDLELAAGNEASACRRLNGPVSDGLYWLKLRAVCAVLADRYSDAELAVEVATAQGLDDPWFIEAIFAASGDALTPPDAKYNSGLNIALSSKANLSTDRVTVSGSRPDLAAAAAIRPGVTPDLKVRFAAMASDRGLIDGATHREIILEHLAQDDVLPGSALEQTLAQISDPLIDPDLRAAALARALNGAAGIDISRYRSTASVFREDLHSLPHNNDTHPYAQVFARAALTLGDTDLAHRWITVPGLPGQPVQDPFEMEFLAALDLMSGGDDSNEVQAMRQDSLIALAETEDQKQAVADLFVMWTGFDYDLGPAARALIREQSALDAQIAPTTLVTLGSAAQAEAIGETALVILSETRGDPATLAPSDVAALISALVEIGAKDIAGQLALEASRFWQRETVLLPPLPIPVEEPAEPEASGATEGEPSGPLSLIPPIDTPESEASEAEPGEPGEPAPTDDPV